MDYTQLSEILEKELTTLEVNSFSNGESGTIPIAESYLNDLAECSSKREKPSTLNMFYRDKKFGSITGQAPSTNEKTAIRIGNDKIKSENHLKKHGVRTTHSEIFEIDDYDRAKKYVETGNIDYAVKPFNLNGGRGVTLNVNSDNFDFAWQQVVNASKERKKPFTAIIQPMISGIETRMLVVEGKFNSAILRMPCHVVGDGVSTIARLIEEKNILREENPYLKRLPIKITDIVNYYLELQKKALDTVPGANEVIFLHKSSNITQGGENYEISHLVGEDMIRTAEEAMLAIPGFHTGGVDLMYQSFDDKEPLVLELNPGANMRMHHYPWKGLPKTPVNDLIDSMLNRYKLRN